MYVARLIGTNIQVISEDMLEAYCVISEISQGYKISIKYIASLGDK